MDNEVPFMDDMEQESIEFDFSDEGEPSAWQNYDLYTMWDEQDNKYISGTVSTNDDLDTGYPSEYASWQTSYKSVKEAQQHVGVTRTGVSGVQVKVTLNGQLVTRPEDWELLFNIEG